MTQVERQFIRHPSAIPLEYCISNDPPQCNMDFVCNVSEGGLSFNSDDYIAPKQWLHLYIPLHENYFEADALVCWCKPTQVTDQQQTRYNVGVRFNDKEVAFSARMVEQVCYIEEYKKNVRREEGRDLSSDQAAAEWIEKYAEQFPTLANG